MEDSNPTDSLPRFETEMPEIAPSVNVAELATGPRPRNFRPRKRFASILFVCTCLSTWLTGGYFFGAAEFNAAAGLRYSLPLMMILVFHEMGHYLQARRYFVPATLPYFIPMPLIVPFGTMGAVIIQGAGVANRRSLFDIAITGPLAGLVVAIPVTFYGILVSEHQLIEKDAMVFGDPLLLKWMYQYVHGPLPQQHDVILNPYLFAGWVGVFITGLNLVPIGQLDGGHILYTLIGRWAHLVSYAILGSVVAYMTYTGKYSFILMIVLLLMMGPRHPPTADDTVSLGWFRVLLGWLSLMFVVIGLTPEPLKLM